MGEPFGFGIISLDIVSGRHPGEHCWWSEIIAGFNTLRIHLNMSSFFCLIGTSKLTSSAPQRSQLYSHVIVFITYCAH